MSTVNIHILRVIIFSFWRVLSCEAMVEPSHLLWGNSGFQVFVKLSRTKKIQSDISNTAAQSWACSMWYEVSYWLYIGWPVCSNIFSLFSILHFSHPPTVCKCTNCILQAFFFQDFSRIWQYSNILSIKILQVITVLISIYYWAPSLNFKTYVSYITRKAVF